MLLQEHRVISHEGISGKTCRNGAGVPGPGLIGSRSCMQSSCWAQA